VKQIGILNPKTLVTVLFCLGTMFGANGLAAEINPCSDDIAKFCKDVKPDRTALMDCLDNHEGELSTQCKDYQSKMTGGRLEIREEMRERVKFYRACKGEIAKFCADAKRGYKETLKCLSEHELSAPCEEMIKGANKADEKKKTE
jgi:hypothetical protein